MKITLFARLRDKFLRMICSALCISAVFLSVHAESPYAEDLLAEMNKPVEEACPAWKASSASLTSEDARLLSCNLLKEVELAREFPEHATRARNDVIIAWLLEKGVPFHSIGRGYIFQHNPKGFRFFNKRFQGMFGRDWQMVFGSRPRSMELVDYEKRFPLDMTGKNTVKSPYEAVVLHMQEGTAVIDSFFLPNVLSLAEWKKRLGDEQAVVAVAGLASVPEVVVVLLPEHPKERLRRTMAIEKHMPWEADKVQAMVREMPESMRLQVYADILELWEANPLYPLRWQSDSLGWEEPLPWQEAGNDERVNRAFAELSSLLAFKQFWASRKNDEDMLEAVRAQMEKGSKRKDRIEFDLRIAAE